MKASKQRKLEAAGWKVGSAADFLELSDAEAMLLNMKFSLAVRVKQLRQSKRMTQTELANLIGSSQSRVAKLETADRSVSMELLVRTLALLGATRSEIGKLVGAKSTPRKNTASNRRLAKT